MVAGGRGGDNYHFHALCLLGDISGVENDKTKVMKGGENKWKSKQFVPFAGEGILQ